MTRAARCSPECPRRQDNPDGCHQRQLIACRFRSELAEWLSMPALHYIFTRTPAEEEDPETGNPRPVIHQEFEALAATNPLAAYNVLIQEARAFFEELPARDRERQEELQQRAQQRKKRPTDLDSHYAKRRRQAAPDAAQQGLLF